MNKNNDNLLNLINSDDCFNAAKEILDDPASILANIMKSIGDGLSIHDRNMRIVYQNKIIIDNFGSHIGDFCYNIYEKRSKVCEGCPIVEAFRTGKTTKALRVGITKDGIPFRFENIASVLRNDKQEIVAGIELCRIVEDREKAFDKLKETLERLKQTQDQLVRAEKLAGIGHLAAGVAHEINNPAAYVMSNLNTMQGYITEFFEYIDSMENLVASASKENTAASGIREGMQNIFDSDDYHYLKEYLPEAVDISLKGMKRIKTIVSSLLSFASPAESERCMVDINEEIESALLLVENQINQKGSVLKNFNDVPKILANSQQLKQMFVNLILNACEAIKKGGKISITTGVKDNYVNIKVSDNGVGIPEDIIQNIFNPFFTTREVGQGVGLGLSIAYRIIESHNGNIDVQSEPEHGTTFTIRLPVILTDDA
ncbi:MAG: ATP-binding protein [Ignavibacteria bacterium]|jgi:signal transduction histidine kinase